MAENKAIARVKKTLQSSKDLAKSTLEHVTKEKDKILEIITNTLVDYKIDEKEAKLRTLADMYNENEVDAINALKADEVLEKKKLSEEYESIVKKQLQMLKADERGQQALQREISEIKQQQRKRSESLKARKKALLVEKERSKRIAALPEPLSRSLQLRLKESDKKDLEAAIDTNPCLSGTLDTVEEVFEDCEDKENMDDSYHEQRKQMQEEWDRKAKKRFNEALRKKRQKQEHAQILKDIENAEKISRRNMARSVSDASGKVPCTLSDRLNHVEKQAAMEDAVEDLYKKSSTTKEHAIEDLEGYEDKWEAKYKQMDSKLETKMIDCIPSFVKENYSYLLEEEPSRRCGNRFAELNDSNDEMNMAYIESPTDAVSGSDRITAVINHLDQMMSESNEVYEKEFKPLLEAETLKTELPKLESFDKAVEVNILKLPTEDKSVEAHEETSSRNQVSSETRSTQADFMSRGVMAFKRKRFGSKYLAQPPNWVEPEAANSNGASWSSSSYYSLPSRHGQPDICKLCDSPSCRMPLVEDEDHHRDCIPLSRSLEKDPVHEGKSPMTPDGVLSATEVKSKISSYVQLVADKYLKKSSESGSQVRLSGENNAGLSMVTPERLTSDERRASYGREIEESDSEMFPSRTSIDTAVEKPGPETPQKGGTQQMTLNLPQIPPYSEKKPFADMDKPKHDEFVKRCHEILTENLSNIFSGEDGADSEVLTALKSAISEEALEDKIKVPPLEFIYHELSTILEMDSALTNDTRRDSSKRLELSGSLSGMESSLMEQSSELVSPEDVKTTSASLIDVPASEVSELAKNIRFVAGSSVQSLPQAIEPKTPLGLISGTLSLFQTPSYLSVSEAPTPTSVVISDFLETPSSLTITDVRSNVSTPSTMKSTESGSISNVLPTPSSQLSAHSLEPEKSRSRPELTTPSTMKFTESGSISNSLATPSFQLSSHTLETEKSRSRPELTTPSTMKSTESGSISNILATPSSQLSAHSRESERSRGTPYSSSFRLANVQHSHLTNLEALPPYFRDISSIKQDGSSQDESSKSTKTKATDAQTVPKHVDDRPMKEHSFMLSPSESNFLRVQLNAYRGNEESRGTPYSSSFRLKNVEHSHLTNVDALPEYFRGISSVRRDRVSQGTSFRGKPLDVQTVPKYLDARISRQTDSDKKYEAEESNSNIFKPMTPHSYVSSQGTTHSKDEIDNGSSQGSFKPMTPRSYISSPSKTSSSRHQLNAFRGSENNNGRKSPSGRKIIGSQQTDDGSFQPMTPHTYVSSENDPSVRHQNFNMEERDNQHRVQSIAQKQVRNMVSDEDTGSGFQPMTSHSNISTPDIPSERQHDFYSKDWGSRHQTNSTSHKSERGSVDSNNTGGSFQPMTPHSNISTPNTPSHEQYQDFNLQGKGRQHGPLFSPQIDGRKLDDTKNTGSSFLPWMPHSNPYSTSQPSKKYQTMDWAHSSSKKEEKHSVAADNTGSGFQPMTPHSYVSTPNLPSQRDQGLDSEVRSSRHHTHSSPQKLTRGSTTAENTGSSFQTMTPHSYISSPGNTNLSSEEDLRYQSSSASSVNFRFRIPHKLISGSSLELVTSASEASDASGRPISASDKTHKSLRLGSKTQGYMDPDADFEDYVMGDGSQVRQELLNIPIRLPLKNKAFENVLMSGSADRRYGSGGMDNEQSHHKAVKVPRSDFFVPQLSTADLGVTEDAQIRDQMAAKVCSSDFFVPQLSPRHVRARLPNGYFSCELADCPEVASGTSSGDYRTCTESASSVSSVTSEDKGHGLMATRKELCKLLTSSSKMGSMSLSDTPCRSADSPNLILEALKRKFASNPSSKASSLCTTPCLSQETLSDISVSKVAHQSTPIKTIEELIQETGILDEPDLTLVTTELTIKPESPERGRLVSAEQNASASTQYTPAMASPAGTPTAGAAASYCESPSMMSFLQHEVSCFAESKVEACSNATQNSVHEQLTNEDEFGQKFAKNPAKFEYKKRTRRLWNNLEEVKTRKLIEEKKKKSAENRLKMKAYSKVYNPPKKT